MKNQTQKDKCPPISHGHVIVSNVDGKHDDEGKEFNDNPTGK